MPKVSLCYSWQTEHKPHPTLEKLLQNKSKKCSFCFKPRGAYWQMIENLKISDKLKYLLEI